MQRECAPQELFHFAVENKAWKSPVPEGLTELWRSWYNMAAFSTELCPQPRDLSLLSSLETYKAFLCSPEQSVLGGHPTQFCVSILPFSEVTQFCFLTFLSIDRSVKRSNHQASDKKSEVKGIQSAQRVKSYLCTSILIRTLS